MEQKLARLELHHGPGFGDHGSRVAVLCHALAGYLGLIQRETDRLVMAAFIHDIGKTGIDPSILEKSSDLTAEEMELVRQHPEVGYKQLLEVTHPSVAEAVLCHHERWDGNGFPNGLKAGEIPRYARIIFLADAYDVMTTGRTYRPRMTQTQAGQELTRLAEKQFDPRLVDAFASLSHELLMPPLVQFPSHQKRESTTDP